MSEVPATGSLWDGTWATVVGVVAGFALSKTSDWWSRRRKNRSHCSAINAEVEFARAKSEGFLADGVAAPLYRLPRVAFDASYPALLSDGAVSKAEGTALMRFFNEVDTLNRGLDRSASATGEELDQEFQRNCLKASRLVSGGPIYEAAAAAVKSHTRQ